MFIFRYDYVFNTAGELKNNLCRQLCSVSGIMIPVGGPQSLLLDSYGPIRSFFYMIWLNFTCVSYKLLIINPITNCINLLKIFHRYSIITNIGTIMNLTQKF